MCLNLTHNFRSVLPCQSYSFPHNRSQISSLPILKQETNVDVKKVVEKYLSVCLSLCPLVMVPVSCMWLWEKRGFHQACWPAGR